MKKKATDLSELLEPVIGVLPDSVLPDPDTVNYYVLANERKIFIDFDVGENLLPVQRMIMRWNSEDKGKLEEERTPIRVYILSYGGDLDYMWSFIDTLMLSNTPIYTINMGVAASAASLIFMSGKKRFMMPNAKVVVHEGSAQLSGDAVKVMDQSESYRRELKRMKDFILEHTSIPKAQLMKKRNNDWELDAEFCLANEVCDKIIENLEEVL